MKRIFSIITLALLLAIVGCGPKEAPEPAKPAGENVTGMEDIDSLSEELNGDEFGELDSALADLEDLDI